MGKRSYPVHFFFCNQWDQSPEMMRTMVDISLERNNVAGEIAGETGIEGLKLDFNNGLRLQIPDGNWHVTIQDYDSGIVFFDQDVSKIILISIEKYYIIR